MLGRRVQRTAASAGGVRATEHCTRTSLKGTKHPGARWGRQGGRQRRAVPLQPRGAGRFAASSNAETDGFVLLLTATEPAGQRDLTWHRQTPPAKRPARISNLDWNTASVRIPPTLPLGALTPPPHCANRRSRPSFHTTAKLYRALHLRPHPRTHSLARHKSKPNGETCTAWAGAVLAPSGIVSAYVGRFSGTAAATRCRR